MALEQGRLITVREASAFLRITRQRLYKLVADGELVAHRIGYGYRFVPSDLEDYLKRTVQRPEAQQ